MQIIKYLKLPFYFDPELLQEEVDTLASLHWQPHYQVKHYNGEWSAIPLRSIDGKTDDIYIAPDKNKKYCDTVFLDKSPYIKQVLQTFHCSLKAVRLLKLNAGSVIKEHRDAELNFENGEVRLHIPVRTHADVEFILDNETIDLNEGECWYMNFNLPHYINNKSSIHRIHLVIDAEVNKWVEDLFISDRCINKKEINDTTNQYDDVTKREMIRNFRQMNTAVSNKMAENLERRLNN